LIFAIVRTAILALLRDRGALALNFILPVAFFSIFALVFGGRRDITPRVKVVVVDEDGSRFSQGLVYGLEQAGSLEVRTRPEPVDGSQQPVYTAATAAVAVRNGTVPVAIIIPRGLGDRPSPSSARDAHRGTINLLEDVSDAVAPLMVSGTLQIVTMTAMLQDRSKQLSEGPGNVHQGIEGSTATYGLASEGIAITSTRVIGEKKSNPLISFYAAGIGVLFLLFTTSGASGALIEEFENGTLDRVLSSHVTMTSLMLGKLTFNSVLAFAQLVLMFVWGWAVFGLDLWTHIPGFVVMGMTTAVSVAAFGLFLASVCRTRAQLGALSTLIILAMSSVGGSMFPRFLMPAGMQKAGLLTINAWAIDGFTKVFWRDEPISHLWPQVLVLVGTALVFLAIARAAARRWEFV
jgi:ABC-2 type transport system permease protein